MPRPPNTRECEYLLDLVMCKETKSTWNDASEKEIIRGLTENVSPNALELRTVSLCPSTNMLWLIISPSLYVLMSFRTGVLRSTTSLQGV